MGATSVAASSLVCKNAILPELILPHVQRLSFWQLALLSAHGPSMHRVLLRHIFTLCCCCCWLWLPCPLLGPLCTALHMHSSFGATIGFGLASKPIIVVNLDNCCDK